MRTSLRSSNALVRRGEIATLQHWAAALPDELVRSNIELAILQGWLLFVSGKHDEALRHLQDVEQRFGLDHVSTEPREQQTLPPGSEISAAISGRIAAIRASIALSQGDLPRTITLSRQALSSLPKESMARSYVAGYLGKAHSFGGVIVQACIELAFIHQARGDTDAASAMMQQAVERAERQRLSLSRGTHEVLNPARGVPTMFKRTITPTRIPDRLSYLWLVIAAALSLFTGGKWVIPLAAWLAPLFLLRFVRTKPPLPGLLLAWLVRFAVAAIVILQGAQNGKEMVWLFRSSMLSMTKSLLSKHVEFDVLRKGFFVCFCQVDGTAFSAILPLVAYLVG